MKSQPVKSAFGPMKPKLDMALAQKLATSPPPKPKAVKLTEPKADKKEEPANGASQTKAGRTARPGRGSLHIPAERVNSRGRRVFGFSFLSA